MVLALLGAILLFTYPVVWLIGYQDHAWRNGAAAVTVALVATAVSLLLLRLRLNLQPPIRRWLYWLALGISVAGLISALVWTAFDSSLVGPID